MEFERGRFYLGGLIDPASGDRTGEPVLVDSDDLTTHGVIVGMTGSGKTGLGIDLIEEAMASGIPCLVIDPKGDMGNLALNFPDFAPGDFEPWVDPAEAKRDGISTSELATRTADTWKSGLESWSLGPERMRSLSASERVTIYTPGSSAGVGLNVLGSLAAPPGSFDDDPEGHRDEIEGYVSSLLTLAGVESDPVSGREHILLATIIETGWRSGTDMDLARVIGQVLKPPFRKLGVFELDTFFPESDRTDLAMKLNGLAASPAFASWLEGEPLDIDVMLSRGGTPQTAVVYLAHLSDAERQFVVTLVLSKLVAWMRRQSGTSDLRALVYMDEVFGFAPPTAEPPSKKPILTILKQARAFGVGMVLSTQNPVDLDYKAMSNAGTWMIGRLQTERDKARILEGLSSASGGVDVARFDQLISGLGKRQFVLHSTGSSSPGVFATRWAMSYLAGPLTRDEIERLGPDRDPAESTTAATPEPDLPDDATSVAPTVAEGIEVVYVDAAAPWREGLDLPGDTLKPGAVATVDLLYDDTAAGVDHREIYEAVIFPLAQTVTADNLYAVDHDDRDFIIEAPALPYGLPDNPIDTKTFWTSLSGALVDHLVRERKVTVFKNAALKLYSRVGESEEEFVVRCRDAAEDAADAEIAKLRDKHKTKIDRIQNQISTAERRVQDLEGDVGARKQQEILSGAGDLLGAILGGRRGSTISKAASRRSQTRRTEQRLQTAIDAMEDKAADLIELEEQLEDDVMEISARWEDAAAATESVDIGLEKTDVSVRPLRLVWLG
ncbi:MAG: DUF87 domain-containing protein [Acidimicrobiia bacterium]|nr:DUF87 domain-containing protein [Acidimicrobiia bacterium]